MLLITEDAQLVCDHPPGKVGNRPSQVLVRIDGRRVLVEADPEGCGISGCPNISAVIKPCTHTLKVREGYSAFVRIDAHRVCLDMVHGYTDGTPPATVDYHVAAPGQRLVASSA